MRCPVQSGTSISGLFIAGVGPGLLILVMFSRYSYIYASLKPIPTVPRASWRQRRFRCPAESGAPAEA